MTLTHLVCALMTMAFILVSTQLEERDLFVAHPEYADYRRLAPMLLPFGSGSSQPRFVADAIEGGALSERDQKIRNDR